MASSNFYLFVCFLFFCILFQKNTLISAGNDCLNPTFGKTQKSVIDIFFDDGVADFTDVLCAIVSQSNGLISLVYRMSSDMKDKATCMQQTTCIDNRYYACNYRNYPERYNDCNATLPGLEVVTADCICDGTADDILIANENTLKGYGAQKLPTLVVNQKYDPCFTDYSFDSMKAYFCKAYNNELPLCKG